MTLRSALSTMILVAAGLAPAARAGVNLHAGGGWSSPRGDSAAYTLNGYSGSAALELGLRDNLGILVGGGYAEFGLRSSKLKADLGLPPGDPLDGETKIIDMTVAPRLYLLNHDIAAFVLFGGGPRWITHHATAAGTGVESERREQAWGGVVGFGTDVDLDGFRIGFSPMYHRISAERRAIEYVTLTIYLKL